MDTKVGLFLCSGCGIKDALDPAGRFAPGVLFPA